MLLLSPPWDRDSARTLWAAPCRLNRWDVAALRGVALHLLRVDQNSSHLTAFSSRSTSAILPRHTISAASHRVTWFPSAQLVSWNEGAWGQDATSLSLLQSAPTRLVLEVFHQSNSFPSRAFPSHVSSNVSRCRTLTSISCVKMQNWYWIS